jgi:hypothetical protein
MELAAIFMEAVAGYNAACLRYRQPWLIFDIVSLIVYRLYLLK